MIADRLTNAYLYAALSPQFRRVFDYLKHTDLASQPCGRYDLDGDRLFLLLQEYAPKPEPEGEWEVHRKYIDVQVMIQGAERMGYGPRHRFKPTNAYDEETDCQGLSGDGTFLTLSEGDFVVFFPDDVHNPGIEAGVAWQVRKAVFKIAVPESPREVPA